VYKIAASAAELAKCIWLYTYSRTFNCSFQLREHKQKLHIAYLTSWPWVFWL